MTTRIASTRTSDLQPLGTAGQLAVESWTVLTALLTRELSSTHAAMLSEPVADPRRGEMDWYSGQIGTPTPLVALSDADREAAEARLGQLLSEVQALGQRLLAGRNDGERFNGEMLLLAIQMPDQSHVFMIDGQPVLVGWGHAHAGKSSTRSFVTGMRVNAGSAMVIFPPPGLAELSPGRRFARLSFLSTLIAVITLCGLAILDPFGWGQVTIAECSLPPAQLAMAAIFQDAAAREAALHLEIARLDADAGHRRLLCTPVAVPPSEPGRDAQRAEQQGARSGKLQIILAWDDQNDLDLHVLCPGGDSIGFQHPRACGGILDVDANGSAENLTDRAVENIYFADPPAGRYQILVDPYGMRGRASTPFRITVRQDGHQDREVRGTVSSGRRNQAVADVDVAVP